MIDIELIGWVATLLLLLGYYLNAKKKIASWVTVFPKDGAKLRINLNTASEPVLLALEVFALLANMLNIFVTLFYGINIFL